MKFGVNGVVDYDIPPKTKTVIHDNYDRNVNKRRRRMVGSHAA